MAKTHQILVATPAHSALSHPLSYLSEQPLALGALVRVPLGKREVLGIVWEPQTEAAALAPPELRSISAVLDGIAPLSAAWRELVRFTASYYQRSLGEVALAALPPQLRQLTDVQMARRLRDKKSSSLQPVVGAAKPEIDPTPNAAPEPTLGQTPDQIPGQTLDQAPPLSAEQQTALQQIQTQAGPFLLFGVTGSGKTEVYLHALQQALQADASAQALLLVPEINLTPQLGQRLTQRFGEQAVVMLHSAMTPAARLRAWLAAHSGQARVVLGTRTAIFASLPRLRLLLVDEEHDASYKQQEGARYSARDLALYRAKIEGAKVVLGSATPALESWRAAQAGRYQRLTLTQRIGAASQPRLRLVDLRRQPKGTVVAPALLQAVAERLLRGEQTLVLLNRRGYAPVLACSACDWKSQCPHCSAYRVFHKIDRSLRCHHCGYTQPVPRACPECGYLDLSPVGRGTERLEEHLAELLAPLPTAHGAPVRIARMDADATRGTLALAQQLARVHAGDVDVLVGTQMVTKGHDFRRMTLVAALNPDPALFASDFRAPERLFSLLHQAGGRAGRALGLDAGAELWVQTHYPQHPLFAALAAHDYPAFAERELQARETAAMPPYVYQALLRAEARSQASALAFLQAAQENALALSPPPSLSLYPPVPMAMQRLAGVERAQMLVESPSRRALQEFLPRWRASFASLKAPGLIRWALDVDPLTV